MATPASTLPIEEKEKESDRWLRGYLECCESAAELSGTEVLSISDREGDIYEIFECWQTRRSEGESTAQWLGFLIGELGGA